MKVLHMFMFNPNLILPKSVLCLIKLRVIEVFVCFMIYRTAMTMFPRIVAHLALLTGAVVMATEQCQYCAPDQQCWPSFQQLVDFNKTLDGYALYPSQPEYRYSTLKLVLSGHSK